MINDITVTDIKEIFMVSSPKGRHAKIENRNSFGLSLCIDGQITYTQNNKKTISDENCAVLLPMGGTYTLDGDKSGSFPVINFTCTEPLYNSITSFPLQNPGAYIKSFDKLHKLSIFGGNRAEIMSIFYHMLHSLSMEYSSCEILLPAVKYLEQNFQNPDISNAELAKQCNISEVYFRKIFKKNYKTSPRQFIIDIRINKAKQLLREGGLKINSVSEICGFSSQYHFCRIFKEKTGLTPTEYMKSDKNFEI